MPRVARAPAIPPLPPAIFAPPPWFSSLRPCHPPKRPIWWTNCPFVSAIHQNGSFGGWPPAPSTNRPGLGLVSRKVDAFSGGPSMPEACFPEGRCLFRGTFHARGLFPGRSAPFQGDLPCQRPVSRKVGAFSGGPSMPEACFPEGPDIILGDQPRRDRFFGRSWGCWQGRWCYPHVFCRGYCQKRRFLRVPSFVFPRVESLGPPADACQGRWCWWELPGGAARGDMPPPARGCLRSDGPCAEGRRGSPVPPHPATHQTPLFASNPNIYYFC